MEDNKTLGERLKEAREYVGLSQEEVAKALSVPRSAISLAESDKRRVDTIELKKFSKIYNRSISELLGEAEEVHVGEHLQRAAQGLTLEDQEELLQFAKFLKSKSDNKRGD